MFLIDRVVVKRYTVGEGHSDSKQGQIISRLPLLRVSVLFSPSAKATEQFIQLALYFFHGWFIHIHLNLGLCQLVIHHCRNHSLHLRRKRIDLGVSVFRVFLNVSVMEWVITGRNHCPQLLLVLDHCSPYIKLIHENLSFLLLLLVLHRTARQPGHGLRMRGEAGGWLANHRAFVAVQAQLLTQKSGFFLPDNISI